MAELAGWRSVIAGILSLGAVHGLLAGCGFQPGAAPARVRATGLIASRGESALQPGGVVDANRALHRILEAPTDAEGVLTVRASVPGADWGTRGQEAVTLRVSVDGIHNQDLVLFAGDRPHEYTALLGHVPAGRHQLTFTRLASHSAAALARVEVEAVQVRYSLPGEPDHEVISRAPILWSREAPHLTDTPLVMMVEDHPGASGGRRLRYTMVFSNEDGGTQTPALLARWGRSVDIDWCYEIERDGTGKPLKETYQGAWHWVHGFEGQREGLHPMLRIATDNNCYSDRGLGPLKFRPLPAFYHDPGATAREEVLDRFPWTYGVAARELFREGKAVRDAQPGPEGFLGGPPAVGDPRRFLVVEFLQQHEGRGVAARALLRGDARPYVSHRGDDGLQAARGGWCRVAVELPRRVGLSDLARLELVGKGRGATRITQVRRVLVFDEAFAPVVLPIQWKGDQWLRSDADRVSVYEAAVSPASP